MAKQKMPIEKKTRLIYSIELLIFAVLFLVIATLEILGLIGKNKTMMTIFNWVTIFGATWMIVDFFWVVFSKKRRAKNSLLDKALLLPLAAYLITFDILCFLQLPFITMEFRRLMMGIAFYYVGAIYLFQAIYHYYHPIPALLSAIEEEKMEQAEEAREEAVKAQAESEEKVEEHKEEKSE